jgi:uncharacterized protein YqeY
VAVVVYAYAVPVRERLRDDLRSAMKARDLLAVNVLRTAIAALDNAEAVDDATGRDAALASEHVAGATAGAYSAGVPRRSLSETEVATILVRQVEERREAAAEYASLGQAEEAARLIREAELLSGYLG